MAKEAEAPFDPQEVFNALGLMRGEDFTDMTDTSNEELSSIAHALAEDDGSKVETHLFYLEHIRQEQRQKKVLLQMACGDPLTKLYNRRFLMGALDREIDRIERGNSKGAAVLMIDLDKFKPINDTHGHLVGDAALVAVAKKVGQNLRRSDIFARVGGDEFVVLATGVGEDEANFTRERVAGFFPVPFESGSLNLKIDASVGMCLVHGAQSAAEVMKAADVEMYKVKGNRGRGGPSPEGGMR